MTNDPRLTEMNPTEPNWSAAALVTIDMQSDFATPAGSCFVPGTDRIRPELHRLVTAFRQSEKPIFHAIRLYLSDGSNAERCRRESLRTGATIARPGTTGADLADGCGFPNGVDTSDMIENPWKQKGMMEWVFYKPRWSAFFDTELASRLKELNVDTIVVAGCNFPNCPSATLFDATERDFRVVLASDAVSGISAAGLEWCKGIGVTPLSTQVIESRVSASARHLCHIPR